MAQGAGRVGCNNPIHNALRATLRQDMQFARPVPVCLVLVRAWSGLNGGNIHFMDDELVMDWV